MRRVLEKRVVQGSVRSVASSSVAVNGMRHYAAYGDPFDGQGSLGTPFGFTGEQTDANGLVYLRARHYAPSVGIFPSLDPFEGDPSRPMSLNGYSWVEGNAPNMVDPSGRCTTNIPCEALPPELSALVNCIPDDRDLGDLVEYLRHLQIIKESSVEIVTGDSHSPDCSALIGSGTWAVSANSGTITHNGVWTHAHYTGTGENFGSIPANNDQAAEWLKSWPCIIFTGATGRVVLRGADLDLNYLNTPAGTLLIQPYQKQANNFTIVDLRTILGTPASDEFVPLGNVDRVYISYHFGANGPNASLNYSREMKTATVNKNFADPRRRHLMETVLQKRVQGEDVPTQGDSGSGVFSNGRLIGVLDFAYHTDTEWLIQFYSIR